MRLLQTYILYFCNNLSIGNLKEDLMVYMVWDISVNLLYSDFFLSYLSHHSLAKYHSPSPICCFNLQKKPHKNEAF